MKCLKQVSRVMTNDRHCLGPCFYYVEEPGFNPGYLVLESHFYVLYWAVKNILAVKEMVQIKYN